MTAGSVVAAHMALEASRRRLTEPPREPRPHHRPAQAPLRDLTGTPGASLSRQRLALFQPRRRSAHLDRV